MKHKDLNILMGRNLRRLRLERNLTQDQLAERLGLCNSNVFTKWEAGRKGIGKRVLLKLCNALNVKPCLFYVDEKTPYITSTRERDIVNILREAEKAGVVDIFLLFGAFIVGQAKKQQKALNKGRAAIAELSCARRRGSARLSEGPVLDQ